MQGNEEIPSSNIQMPVTAFARMTLLHNVTAQTSSITKRTYDIMISNNCTDVISQVMHTRVTVLLLVNIAYSSI